MHLSPFTKLLVHWEDGKYILEIEIGCSPDDVFKLLRTAQDNRQRSSGVIFHDLCSTHCSFFLSFFLQLLIHVFYYCTVLHPITDRFPVADMRYELRGTRGSLWTQMRQMTLIKSTSGTVCFDYACNAYENLTCAYQHWFSVYVTTLLMSVVNVTAARDLKLIPKSNSRVKLVEDLDRFSGYFHIWPKSKNIHDWVKWRV